MKTCQHRLGARLALALCALIGGAPGVAALPTNPVTPPDVKKSGTDGVGGIERTGPKPLPSAPGPASTAVATLPGGTGAVGGLDVGAWIDLGLGLPGHAGLPVLAGTTIDGQGHVTLTLTGAKPFAPATLIVGLDTVSLPFKGGTLVPRPDLLIMGLPVGADGALVLSAQLPTPLPSGLSLCVQMWMPDAAAAQGFAASNGLELLIR